MLLFLIIKAITKIKINTLSALLPEEVVAIPYAHRDTEKRRGMASAATKPHAICIPLPVQGHINAMLELAKLLHSKGFHVTFVHTEFNYKRILKSTGPSSLQGAEDFRLETIPDGLPPSDDPTSRDIPSIIKSVRNLCAVPFRSLLARLNDPSSGVPPVTCMVSDGCMSFTLQVAAELQIPNAFFWSTSACGFMGFLHIDQLLDRGLFPLKSERDLSDENLDTLIDWIPGMKNLRLKDVPRFTPFSDPDNTILEFVRDQAQKAHQASAIIVNTLIDMEGPVLEAMSLMLPPVYAVGPVSLFTPRILRNSITPIGSNFWTADPFCLEWLETRKTGSVIYVNFGSLAIITSDQLVEFAWGLANSGYDFLWVIRSDLVKGDSAVLPQDFLTETKERGFLTSWCSQKDVLLHRSVGGFLTHSGWNSTMESISAGAPMICWPFFGDQQTNSRYACIEWGIGMEINNNVKRKEVSGLVRELMEGEKGKDMRKKALGWKERAMRATAPGGSSHVNLDRVIEEVLLQRKYITE